MEDPILQNIFTRKPNNLIYTQWSGCMLFVILLYIISLFISYISISAAKSVSKNRDTRLSLAIIIHYTRWVFLTKLCSIITKYWPVAPCLPLFLTHSLDLTAIIFPHTNTCGLTSLTSWITSQRSKNGLQTRFNREGRSTTPGNKNIKSVKFGYQLKVENMFGLSSVNRSTPCGYVPSVSSVFLSVFM